MRALLLTAWLAGCASAPVLPRPVPESSAVGSWVALARSDTETISYDSARVRRTPEGRFAVRMRWALATPHAPDETEPFAYDTYEADREVDCSARTDRAGDAAWYLNGTQVRFAMGLGHEGGPAPGSIGARAMEALCRRVAGA